MVNDIFDPTINALNTSLNLRLLRQNIINSNIANSDTPGYKATRVEFESDLRDALNAGDKKPLNMTKKEHINSELSKVYPKVYKDTETVPRLDGNNVNRSKEMAKSAENQLLYDASIEALKRKLDMLKYAVNDGGGSR